MPAKGSFSAKLSKIGLFPHDVKVERRLSDLRKYFYDKRAVESILSRGEDPLIYVVYEIGREREGELNVGCTIIYPGKIGDEYYFTKGHFHVKEAGEVYLGISGEGLILMQDRYGGVFTEEIRPETIVYVPPGLAHRSVNTGKNELIFLAIYPSDAGHDYETVDRIGFAKIVVERDGKPTLIDNPNYRGEIK
ncbi:MAG: glucose-6-phosphate isomerase family protein [Candidatus Bathyarchaeia archaeon]|nr:glucose-6-phosphate isomerase [Candidatus Bathyarchaeota archaeon]